MSPLPDDPLQRELAAVLACPTGTSSAGYPYLIQPAWERVRDWVPHLLADGPRVLEALDRVEAAVGDAAGQGGQVVRQVVRTAAITAPGELWLLRHVLSTLKRVGLLDRLARGETVDPHSTGLDLCADELAVDLELLLARGYLVRCGEGYLRSDGDTARRVLSSMDALELPADLGRLWTLALAGEATDEELDVLRRIGEPPAPGPQKVPPRWVASVEEIETGWRLVPLVVGLRGAERVAHLLAGGRLERLLDDPGLDRLARAILSAAGTLDGDALTRLGRRVLARGPGPFGILEAYHPYMTAHVEVLRRGRSEVHVERGTNVAASQDANRRTFERANDALDRFCADTGFAWDLFVEHAVGRGEAIRQRHARSGDGVSYVGADLEEAALDAARAERDAGHLPSDTVLIRADIGAPEVLVAALRDAGVDPQGGVMVVGNGFHEVREASDARMIEVFEGYERAGLLLLFTEESALPVDDLLQTAWNTYHAGFRYVHARSGQGLRPAHASPPSRFGTSVGTSWTECAEAAGYVRADAWSSRSRTIHPYPPANGYNPSISVNHFFVPAGIARRLGLDARGPDDVGG